MAPDGKRFPAPILWSEYEAPPLAVGLLGYKEACEENRWQATDIKTVWKDLITGYFHFSDEAEQIDVSQYTTKELASAACALYSETLR